MINFLRKLALCTLITSCALLGLAFAQENNSLKPLTIAYTINLVSEKYGNATLGKVETELNKTNDGYSVYSATKAQGIAAILMGSNYRETCRFHVEGGRAISNAYSGGRKDLTDYNVDFDWKSRKIMFSDGESLDMPRGYVVDNCNILFAAALLAKKNMGLSEPKNSALRDDGLLEESLYIVDGKSRRIRGYKMKAVTQENLDTDFGNFNTLKIEFERELHPGRTLTFWLAPEYANIPLKMVERRRKRTTTFLVDRIEPS